MLFDRSKDSSECFFIKFKEFTIFFSSYCEWSRLVSDQSNLSEMIACFQSSDDNKSFSSFIFMEFQTIARPWFYDIEFFTFITFSDDSFSLEIVNRLETIDQFQLLEFIKAVKKFNLVEESSFLSSSGDARFDNQSFEKLAI